MHNCAWNWSTGIWITGGEQKHWPHACRRWKSAFFSLSYADLFHKSLYLVTCVQLATSFCFSNLIIHLLYCVPGDCVLHDFEKRYFFHLQGRLLEWLCSYNHWAKEGLQTKRSSVYLHSTECQGWKVIDSFWQNSDINGHIIEGCSFFFTLVLSWPLMFNNI